MLTYRLASTRNQTAEHLGVSSAISIYHSNSHHQVRIQWRNHYPQSISTIQSYFYDQFHIPKEQTSVQIQDHWGEGIIHLQFHEAFDMLQVSQKLQEEHNAVSVYLTSQLASNIHVTIVHVLGTRDSIWYMRNPQPVLVDTSCGHDSDCDELFCHLLQNNRGICSCPPNSYFKSNSMICKGTPNGLDVSQYPRCML